MASSSENFNGGWGGSFGDRLSWEQFDALPWEIRRIYCFAAYEYTAREAWAAWRAGVSVFAIVKRLRKDFRGQLRREVRRLYGPEHPQAGA